MYMEVFAVFAETNDHLVMAANHGSITSAKEPMCSESPFYFFRLLYVLSRQEAVHTYLDTHAGETQGAGLHVARVWEQHQLARSK